MTDTEQVQATLQGLNDWFRHTFEKAGWIVLAQHRKTKDASYQSKLDSYKIGIKKLKQYLKARLNNPMGNETIKRDFPHMIQNLNHLKAFVKSLSTANLSHDTVKSSDDVSVEDMTLCAMQHYYKHMFEKYGWMVLTKKKLQNGDYDKKPLLKKHKETKLKMYGESLEVLVQSLVHRMNTCNDVDKNNVEVDLASMIRNVNVLKSCFNNHLMQESESQLSATSDATVVPVTQLSSTSVGMADSVADTTVDSNAQPDVNKWSLSPSPKRSPRPSPSKQSPVVASPRLSPRPSPRLSPRPSPRLSPSKQSPSRPSPSRQSPVVASPRPSPRPVLEDTTTMGENTAREAQALGELSTSINMVNTEKELSERPVIGDTTSTMGKATAQYAQALGELSSSEMPKRSPRPYSTTSADLPESSQVVRNSPNLSLFTPTTESIRGGMSDYEKIAKLFQ